MQPSKVTDPEVMFDFAERLHAMAEAGSEVSDRLSWWWLLRWAEATVGEE